MRFCGEQEFQHTSRNAVDLVLNEEVDQRDECREERRSEELPVLDGCRVARAQGKAAQSPRQSSD